mgnify:CR=1 FL=1
MATFDDLLAEGESVPIEGWDFSWFEGRATEQRPSWGYAGLMARRMATASRALDVQTGGGEVLATIGVPPPLLVATEGWAPNVAVARRRLAPIGALVVEAAAEGCLPFAAGVFDLVVSRHPVTVRFDDHGPSVAGNHDLVQYVHGALAVQASVDPSVVEQVGRVHVELQQRATDLRQGWQQQARQRPARSQQQRRGHARVDQQVGR